MRHPAVSIPTDLNRLAIAIQGTVQGVGFRPFVYGLAVALDLRGWVKNSPHGVSMEIEGEPAALNQFLQTLQTNLPPHATIQVMETVELPPIGYGRFEIRASELTPGTGNTAVILPDLATCSECLQELFNPGNRRYRYPMINCTHCGPRFSIVRSLPYDRPNTTMRHFTLCPRCQAEYTDPLNRRFHAQPNACPDCGPHLELWDRQGHVLASDAGAAEPTCVQQAAALVVQGNILAMQGIGGFHLIVDAQNEPAVQTLRHRKHRPDKPLAIMAPSLDWVRQICEVSDVEAQLLTAPEAPIVLLRRLDRHDSDVAPSLAPGNPYLGVMLPYTPLHHLLMAELQRPIVATSGNVSHDPICIDPLDALERLRAIADAFLVHNRPIARPVDDSIVQVIQHQPIMLRRARGYAPLPCHTPNGSEFSPLLALGAHLKNTVALAVQSHTFLSQYIGDLDTPRTTERFQEAIQQLLNLYDSKPVAIACDAHPDYYSSQYAQALADATAPPIPVVPIQHHYAHVLAGMVDNQLTPPVLGIAWDGTGYGLDGTIWGGEWLAIADPSPHLHGFQRIAHLRPFRLPGGDQAAKEPRRSALGLLYELWGDAVFEHTDLDPLQAFSSQELTVLTTLLQRGTNAPLTSSAGRLFDAIASLLNLCQQASFEGQAAMQLEFAAADLVTEERYAYSLQESADAMLVMDWRSMVQAIIEDIRQHQSSALISAKFHNTMVDAMVAIAQRCTIPSVVLTGGCFQNRYLLNRAIQHLNAAGFQVAFHHRIPTNDAGIAVGQIAGALRALTHHPSTLVEH